MADITASTSIPEDPTGLRSGSILAPHNRTDDGTYREPPTSLTAHYFRYQLRQVTNSFTKLDTDGKLKVVGILGLGVMMFLGCFFGTRALVETIMGQESLGPLRIVLLTRLLNMLTLLFGAMLIYSNLVASVSTLYLGRDLPLLINTPLSIRLLFRTKIMEVFLQSSWMLLIFGIPIYGAYGYVLGASPVFYATLPVMLLLYLIIPAGIGIGGTILLVQAFPAKQIHRFMVLAGLIFGVALVVVMVLARPTDLVNPVGSELLTSYLENMRVPSLPWLPSTWVSEGFMSGIEGDLGNLGRYIVLLLAGSGTAVIFALFAGELFFFNTWTQAQDAHIQKGRQDNLFFRLFLAALKPVLPYSALLLVEKDLKTFFRDARQWSQIFILAAIMIVFVWNFTQLPFELLIYRKMMSFIALGGVAAIMATIASRFAYPAVSMEGRGFYLLQVSPLSFGTYAILRCTFFAVPSTMFALVMMYICNVVLEVDRSLMGLTMVSAGLLSLAMCYIGFGIGARNLRFDTDNPAEMLVGLGGLWFMLNSLGLLGVTITLIAIPEILRFFPQFFPLVQRSGGWDYVACYIAAVVVTLALSGFHVYRGARWLERYVE